LYIFSKSLEQDVYQELKDLYEELSDDKVMQIAHFFNSCEELISVDILKIVKDLKIKKIEIFFER